MDETTCKGFPETDKVTNKNKCGRNKSEGNNEEVRKNDGISRGKSCPNSARIEHMQTPMGKLRRMCAVGSDEGTRWTSCRFVQPRYRIGKDDSQRPLHNVSEGSTLIESQGCCSNLSMVVEIMESESNRHQLAVAANQGPCEVSSLTECMNAKSDYVSYFDEVKNFGFNHIILVGKREYGIIFLDCYGRLFELDMMSGVLWPLGNSLEEAKTKPWTGEVAWNIGDDGSIFEFEYYTEAKQT
ncbi:7925_t:CDS:2 [Rhizophagus irregularis]|nr:7925_t:CDS:2 [Rhizophagus irregularis]